MAESSRRTDDPLAHALALASAALAEAPAGLLTDFDGTLSPIVADPATSRLVDGAATTLRALAERLAVVAIVTGRAPLDARRMTGVPGLLVAGNHGMEWLEPGADRPIPSPEAARVRDRIAAVLATVPDLPGVTIEDKGLSATIHYRNAEAPEEARRAIVAALPGFAPGGELELRPGRMSLELRPTGLGDKGAATHAIIERFGLRGAVVMGDDVTDLDMFAAVADRRDAGLLRGVIVGVGGADGETPASVVEAADVVLRDPAEAAALLAALAGA
ncbi:MAG TPA: trehalose-phosphatase [Patescibacteria group bacterium]|nr:trehalose-phosphatase [Patescibacteria group bacterium]